MTERRKVDQGCGGREQVTGRRKGGNNMALKGWEADLTRELLRMLWRIDRMPREHKGRLMRRARQVFGGAVDSDERIALALLEALCGERPAVDAGRKAV